MGIKNSATNHMNDAAKDLPHSLQIVSECLPDMSPPDGAFDPTGEWENTYVAWVALRGPAGKSWDVGGLRIRRRITPRGPVLIVNHTCRLRDPGKLAITHAVVNCEDDELSTPRSWDMVSHIVHVHRGEVPLTRTRTKGSFDGRKLVLDGGTVETRTLSSLLTSNWSLLDATQRMSQDMETVRFDLLEGLGVVKQNQMIRPGETVDVQMAGKNVRLHSFIHIGEGILPYTYWLDERNRLVMAVGGLCTYLYNTDAQILETQR